MRGQTVQWLQVSVGGAQLRSGCGSHVSRCLVAGHLFVAEVEQGAGLLRVCACVHREWPELCVLL